MATDKSVKFVLSAEDRVSRVLAGVQNSLGGLGTRAEALNGSFGKLGLVFGAAFAGTTFTAFVRGTVQGLDALNDLKDATGSSIENLSALEDIGARTGTRFESVGDILVKFNKVLGEAKLGSEAANTLKSIGVNAAELRKLDPAEALQRTALALKGFADDGDKARIVQELFGKSIKEAAPFLKDLAEAGQLQAKVTTQQAEEAERFNKQLFALQKNSTDLAREMTAKLVPVLNEVLEKFQGIKSAERAGQGGFFSSIAKEFKANAISDELRVLTDEILRLDAYMQKNPGDPKLELRMKQLREEALQLQRQAAAASQALKGFGDVATTGALAAAAAATRPDVPDRPDKTDDKVTAYQRLIEKIRERSALESAELSIGAELAESDKLGLQLVLEMADAKNKLTVAERANAAARLEELLGFMRSNEERVRQVKVEAEAARAREGTVRINERLLADLAQEAEARVTNNQRLRDEGDALGLSERALERLQVQRLEQAAAIERENLLLAQNAEASAEEVAGRERNIRLLEQEIQLLQANAEKRAQLQSDPRVGLRRAVDEYVEGAENVADATQRLVERTTGGLEDSLTALLSGQRTNFRQLVNDTIAEVTRLYVVKPLLADIFKGASGGGGGSSLGSLLGLLGSFSGGGGGLSVDPYGTGITSGNTGLSDLGMGAKGKTGAPAGVVVTVNQSISVGAGVGPSQLTQALQRSKEEVKAEIQEAIRRGAPGYR